MPIAVPLRLSGAEFVTKTGVTVYMIPQNNPLINITRKSKGSVITTPSRNVAIVPIKKLIVIILFIPNLSENKPPKLDPVADPIVLTAVKSPYIVSGIFNSFVM